MLSCALCDGLAMPERLPLSLLKSISPNHVRRDVGEDFSADWLWSTLCGRETWLVVSGTLQTTAHSPSRMGGAAVWTATGLTVARLETEAKLTC